MAGHAAPPGQHQKSDKLFPRHAKNLVENTIKSKRLFNHFLPQTQAIMFIVLF